jgi:hypothetical protein
MRDAACWESKYKNFYIDLAAYCNQVFVFKKLSFKQFLLARHTNKERIDTSLNLWNFNLIKGTPQNVL